MADAASQKLANDLARAEARKTLNVLECSVTQCTLEQIFVRLADKRGATSASMSGRAD